MQLSYLLVVSLVALACASSTQSQVCVPPRLAKYDDLSRQPPASVPKPIPPYLGLIYKNIVLLTPPAGIMPASSPNVFGFGQGSPPSVTIIGGGTSKTEFFPDTIAYACAVRAVGTAVSVPISCTLAISGYKAGVLVKRQNLNYEVAIGEVNKTMSVANLGGIGFVDTLIFEVVTPTQLVVEPRFDNFSFYESCRGG